MDKQNKSTASLPKTVKRAGKVKTGCLTCKIRKVKCDEARPSCHRCLSTGRVCDGYGIWGGGNRPVRHNTTSSNASVITAGTISSPPLYVVSANEQACMEWFILRTTTKLPGPWKLAFWTTLLPQACTTTNAVFRAVLALSSVHKVQALDIRDGTMELFMLQQYNRATNDLRSLIGRGKDSIRATLITCAIFIHLEYLRGCYRTATIHLRHGLAILEHISSVDMVDEWIVDTFTTFFIQAKLAGQDVAFPQHLQRKPGLRFSTLYQGRQALEHILLRIIGVGDASEIFLDCEAVHNELNLWLEASEICVCTSTLVDQFSWKLLRIYNTMALIMVKRLRPANSELQTTMENPFRSILNQCQPLFDFVRNNSARADDASEVIADIGWIPPIYYTALHSCDQRTRKRAVGLLRLVPHREGVWNSVSAAMVAEERLLDNK